MSPSERRDVEAFLKKYKEYIPDNPWEWDNIPEESSGLGEARKRPEPAPEGAEAAGEAYAREQLAGDYFQQWVWEQMVEGDRERQRDPSSVIDDPRQIAKNMLQQLLWDTKRELDVGTLLDLSGGGETRAAVTEFYEGFDGVLRDPNTVRWLTEIITDMEEDLRKQKTRPYEAPEQERLPGVRERGQWGIWDETSKDWKHDPLVGSHRPDVPARFKSRADAERAADRDWRPMNPDRVFTVKPLTGVREAFQRHPVVRVVVKKARNEATEGRELIAYAYDDRGYKVSQVMGSRAYVDQKIAEWWPGVPVEYEGAGVREAMLSAPTRRGLQSIPPVGTKVRLTGAFLKFTGQQAGREGSKVFTVKGGSGDFVIVDEEADTAWFTPDEMAADPSLKWRRINKANLQIVGAKPKSGDYP